MTKSAPKSDAGQDLGQLLRLHERLMVQLKEVRDELVAPTTRTMVERFHNRTGKNAEGMGPVTEAVEQAIRAVKLSESTLRREIDVDHAQARVDGVDNLPPALARFIAERSENPLFSYEVIQDENRGWVIQWKEYWGGRVRGSGQFYERPYAWLND